MPGGRVRLRYVTRALSHEWGNCFDLNAIYRYCGQMYKRTTLRLPKDLLARAKRKAATEGRTLTSLIEDGLRLVMRENSKTGKTKRILPPISSAAGGMPRVDLTDGSRLQEIDDLEYVRRLKKFK